MAQNALHDEAEVLRIIADQQKAVCAKDVDRIMSHYAAEFCVFNVKPPFQIRGATEWRRVWEGVVGALSGAVWDGDAGRCDYDERRIGGGALPGAVYGAAGGTVLDSGYGGVSAGWRSVGDCA